MWRGRVDGDAVEQLRRAFKRALRNTRGDDEADLRDYLRDVVLDAMTRSIWTLTWADAEAERGVTYPGQDLLDVAPPPTAQAKAAVNRVLKRIEAMNQTSVVDLLVQAARADGLGWAVERTLAADFGFALGYMVLGHGVSWFDDHARFPLRTPSIEAALDDGELWISGA